MDHFKSRIYFILQTRQLTQKLVKFKLLARRRFGISVSGFGHRIAKFEEVIDLFVGGRKIVVFLPELELESGRKLHQKIK